MTTPTAIERRELPEGQWFERHTRATHGQMKQIEKGQQAALSAGVSLDVEDSAVMTLVTDWHVLGIDGEPIALKKGALDAVPQDTLSLIVDDLNGIIAAAQPNTAISNLFSVLEGLRLRRPAEKRQAVADAIAALREALEVPVPNAGGQTDR